VNKITVHFLKEKSSEIDTEKYLAAGKISRSITLDSLLYMLKGTRNEHFFTEDENNNLDAWLLK